MVRLNTTAAVLGVVASVLSSSARVGAAASADAVVSYVPGSAPSGYQTPAAALGELNPDTNAGNTFGYGALTPFNAPYQGGDIVAIGAGGNLTLHLAQPAAKIGVHAAVGLIDSAYPTGRNTPVASTYTAPRQAAVSVSQDGVDYIALGAMDFDIPSNYFDQGVTTPSAQTSPGTHRADFGKPFTAALSSFDGKDWAGTLDVLDGSAGGEWLDLFSVLPAGANFIRFSVPVGQADPMFLDAVAVVPVPEPAGALALASVGALLLGSRRRHRNRR